MKNSNEDLATKIVDMVLNKSDIKRSQMIANAENWISWQMDDAFKIIKNINQTSLNSTDRTQRLIDLEIKFGIPKTHLI